jgi:hypothetical protein
MWSPVRVKRSRRLCPSPLSLLLLLSLPLPPPLSISRALPRCRSLSLTPWQTLPPSLPQSRSLSRSRSLARSLACRSLARFFSEGRSGSPPAGSPVSTEQVGKAGRAVSEDDVSKSETIRPHTTVFFIELRLCSGILADIVAQPCNNPVCGQNWCATVAMRQVKCSSSPLWFENVPRAPSGLRPRQAYTHAK